MKQTDIAAIILIAAVSAMIAYFAASSIIGKPTNKSVTVKTAEAISSKVNDPNPKIFNSDAINPTVEVEIGGQ